LVHFKAQDILTFTDKYVSGITFKTRDRFIERT